MSAPTSRATAREWTGLAVLALPTLLISASAAFTAALQLVAAVEAGVLLLIAIVALTALRGVKPLGPGAGAHPTPLAADRKDRLAAAQ